MSRECSLRPTFSVVIPTYNRPHLVKRAISSVLAQSFDDFELIISDDGSTLDYATVMTPFLQDDRVQYIKAPVNRGAGAARNLGISLAKGAFVALLDDDDEFLSSALEASYRTLTSGGSRGHVSFAGIQWLDDGAEGQVQPLKSLEFKSEYPDEISLFETFLSIGTGYGLCISTECFRAIGTFNESLRTAEDTELFLRIVDGGFRPRVTPGVHVLIHEHKGKRLTGKEMFAGNIQEIRRLLISFDRLFAQHPTLKTQLIAHMNYLSGQLEYAAEFESESSEYSTEAEPVRKQA